VQEIAGTTRQKTTYGKVKVKLGYSALYSLA